MLEKIKIAQNDLAFGQNLQKQLVKPVSQWQSVLIQKWQVKKSNFSEKKPLEHKYFVTFVTKLGKIH